MSGLLNKSNGCHHTGRSVLPGDAVDELGVIDTSAPPLVRSLVPEPNPVLDRLPHHRSAPAWATAGCGSRRGQAAAERRTADRHGEQPILVANAFCSAE